MEDLDPTHLHTELSSLGNSPDPSCRFPRSLHRPPPPPTRIRRKCRGPCRPFACVYCPLNAVRFPDLERDARPPLSRPQNRLLGPLDTPRHGCGALAAVGCVRVAVPDTVFRALSDLSPVDDQTDRVIRHFGSVHRSAWSLNKLIGLVDGCSLPQLPLRPFGRGVQTAKLVPHTNERRHLRCRF